MTCKWMTFNMYLLVKHETLNDCSSSSFIQIEELTHYNQNIPLILGMFTHYGPFIISAPMQFSNFWWIEDVDVSTARIHHLISVIC